MITIEYIRETDAIDVSYPLNNDTIQAYDGDINSYEWSVDSFELENGAKLNGYNKKARQYTVKLCLKGTLVQRYQKIQTLIDAFEEDTRNNRLAVFRFGDWRIRCNVIKTNVTINKQNNNRTDVELTLYCPYGEWYKSTKLIISKSASSFRNDSNTKEDFKIEINGACTNPSVKIGNNTYKVNVGVPSNSTLIINSQEKTIYLFNNSTREVTNVFDKRARFNEIGNDIFAKIETGVNEIINSTGKTVTITTYQTRSTPKWI